MWFFYNGFLHSAGHHKSRRVCTEGSDNEHQIGMYTPWANSIKYLSGKCPSTARLVSSDFHCAGHLLTGNFFYDFYYYYHTKQN